MLGKKLFKLFHLSFASRNALKVTFKICTRQTFGHDKKVTIQKICRKFCENTEKVYLEKNLMENF